MAKKITAVVNDAEMTTSVLASEIQRISAAVRKLRAGKLNDDTLVLLIQNAAPKVKGSGRGAWNGPKVLSAKAVRAVLEGLDNLATAHLKQTPQKP